MRLTLAFKNVRCTIELDDEHEVVKKLLEKLPIKSTVNTWGEEIYFSIPVQCREMKNPKDVVEKGDVGFWPPGRALCLFFGKTPISDDKIRPASTVDVIGRIVEGMENLHSVKDGEEVSITAASS